jgi:hypothetical protein
MHATFVPPQTSQNLGCADIIERAPSVGGVPLEMPLGQLICKVSTKKTQFFSSFNAYTSIILELSN